MDPEIVRHVSGRPIDPEKILEVFGPLDEQQWGLIEAVYPEIKTAGPNAPFRTVERLTIFPPQFVPKALLYAIVGGGDRVHRAYPHPNRTHPAAVLVYGNTAYPEIHIYRLWPSRRRRG